MVYLIVYGFLLINDKQVEEWRYEPRDKREMESIDACHEAAKFVAESISYNGKDGKRLVLLYKCELKENDA